jgi:hypothetical protein
MAIPTEKASEIEGLLHSSELKLERENVTVREEITRVDKREKRIVLRDWPGLETTRRPDKLMARQG